MIYLELILFVAIMLTLGAASYAGRKIFVAVLSLAELYKESILAQQLTLRQMADHNAHSFNLLFEKHVATMTNVSNAHTAMLGGIAESHLSGATALANTCRTLETSTITIAEACQHLNESATEITKALGSSFMKDISDQLLALKTFIVPRN